MTEDKKKKPIVDRSAPIVNRPLSPSNRPQPPAVLRPTNPRPLLPRENSSKGKILVVDDEQAVADSLTFMLNHEGYKTEAVYSGDAAVKKAKEFKPDLVISDVIMPGRNGIDACIEISRGLPGCKAMLFSGQTISRDLVDEAGKEGHNFDLVEKPLHPQELLSRVRFALSR